ncbi:MAG: PfkB family carbohydrate kinase [Pikeienuella sp.]|uniref:PfkB family carbohydrate kinase n=1 Tax=Pikeienuella sp. TaxID=2831957 RepID=UPI00391C0CC7
MNAPGPDIPPDILCIGAVLWDVIGRAEVPMPPGADRPGRIVRRPGGVALNVARALRASGLRPALLGHVGLDPEGEALVSAAEAEGIDAAFLSRGGRTDLYMAVEGPEGLVAAVADAGGLEAAGAAILAPLADGRLGSADAPWRGPVALDGNLTAALMAEAARSPLLAAADLRLAPASPGKAERLAPFLARPGATLYLNLEEAGLLAGRPFAAAPEAAEALVAAGALRVLVTDGPRPAAFAAPGLSEVAAPPPTEARRVTGAGDCFMAGHIAAELSGATPRDALLVALEAAARHVSEAP